MLFVRFEVVESREVVTCMTQQLVRSAKELGEVSVVALSGELDLRTGDSLVDWLIERPSTIVVVDLDQLTFMDSAGIGALIRARNKLVAEGKELVLTRPTANIRRLFEVTGLAEWFQAWDPSWSG